MEWVPRDWLYSDTWMKKTVQTYHESYRREHADGADNVPGKYKRIQKVIGVKQNAEGVSLHLIVW